MATGNLVNQPSWDAQRYTDPAQMDKNLEANNVARAASGVAPAQIISSSSQQTNTSTGPVTADILRSKFGFTNDDVINNILNNPDEVAKYTREISGGETQGPVAPPAIPVAPPAISDDQIKSSYSEKTGGIELDNDGLQAIKDAYANSMGDINGLLDNIIQRQTESAQGVYEATMSLLSDQKAEAAQTAERQTSRLKEDKQTALERSEQKRGETQKDITNQQEQFKATSEQERDRLGSAWRALSQKSQAIARASGRQDSGFAQSEEGKLLLDLNKGLRELASFSQVAAKDFADAIIDANTFYDQQNKEIETSANRAMEDVDSWLQSTVTTIQGQERLSLAQKLKDINDAINTADQYRIQISQKIADYNANLDTWLYQTTVNFNNALKTADYQAKISSAKSAVNSAYDQMKIIKQGLDTGLLSMRIVPAENQAGTANMLSYNPETGGFDTAMTGQIYGSLPGVGEVQQNVPLESVQSYQNKNADSTDKLIQAIQNM